MATTQHLVVAAFRNRAQAEQAVNELLQAGFDHQHIRFAGQGIPTGGILETIKNVFAGQDTSAGGTYNELVNMGVPPEDARYYRTEFEAGHTVVVVMGTGLMQEAITVLTRHGGYSAKQRFAQSADYGRDVSVQVPPTDDGNAQHNRRPPTDDVNAQYHYKPSTDDVNAEYNRRSFQQQGAGTMQESQQETTNNAYYDLVSILYHALEAEQTSATYVQDAQQSGNRDLEQFFSDVQRDANRQAERAKQLLGHTSSDARSFGRHQQEESRSPAQARDFSLSQGGPS